VTTADAELNQLLSQDLEHWRADLDARYGRVLNDVLEGRRPAIVVPAARMGQFAASALMDRGVRVIAFGDRSQQQQGQEILGLPVLSPAVIAARHRDAVCLVATTLFDSEIAEDLRMRGCEVVIPVGYLNRQLPDVFPSREYHAALATVTDDRHRSSIEAAFSLLHDEESRRTFIGKLGFYLNLDKSRLDAIKAAETMYFDASVHAIGSDERVVDGGAYIGDTLEAFLAVSSGRFRSYVAFEPDEASFRRLSAMAASDPDRVIAVRAGLGATTTTARLLATQGLDSRVLQADESGGDLIDVVSLDDYFSDQRPPSFIKLDIEGAEADALLGATGIIDTARPLLAVSVYHQPADLWSLPLLMRRLAPDSQLHLRHYSREVDDTVCYAVAGGG
jgi:FkbM family methyltransferase